LSGQLQIATNNRAKLGEAVDFLAETGSVSPADIERLRGIVAADETLNDKSWDVASFSTRPSETYDYWANDYSPSTSMGFDGWRERRQGWHNGLDLMGGNEQVQSAFGNGTVTSTEAWGGGTYDPGSRSNSNAIRVEYELPNRDETFSVDYGHMQNNGTLNVQNGDTIEAGEVLGRTSFDDGWSNGGHLDVKIRIPNSLTSEFAPEDTRATGGGQSFVDVQAFMRWYAEQTPN
ncbi:MAG: peptidoglycan DD-metalloendopeptidase family protein, partial [Myxococcota bacterium]